MRFATFIQAHPTNPPTFASILIRSSINKGVRPVKIYASTVIIVSLCYFKLPFRGYSGGRYANDIESGCQLLISAKHRALEEKISLACVIENALRESLTKPMGRRETVRLITVPGAGVKPGVDLDNGRSLLDIMGDPS